jgi:hypothetical protein
MKRYMCRKTIKEDPTGEVIFVAGRPYNESTDPVDKMIAFKDWTAIIDRNGAVKFFSEDFMIDYFQELPDDLPVPRDEAYPEPFITPEPRRKLTAGWAWFIVLITTLTAIILSEIL